MRRPRATWTILVPTLGQRGEYLCQMLDGLLPQVDAQDGRVKVLAYWDNGEAGVAVKKQALLEAATTDYVSFVDDDDTVSDDYVSAVVAALQTWPDFVGLKLQVYSDGRPFALSHHSLRHGGWLNEGAEYLRRDITCANPMRADIARTAKFTVVERGQPEDVAWVGQLRAGRQLRTEVFIDRVLYHYWWSPTQSAWMQPDKRIQPTDEFGHSWWPAQVDSPHFAWHPASPLPEGEPDGGAARYRPCADPHMEHRAPADRVGRDERVGRGRHPRRR